MITVQGAPTISVTIATIASVERCIFDECYSPIAPIAKLKEKHNLAYRPDLDSRKKAVYEEDAADQKN